MYDKMDEREWEETDYPERAGFLIGYIQSALDREPKEMKEKLEKMLEDIGEKDA